MDSSEDISSFFELLQEHLETEDQKTRLKQVHKTEVELELARDENATLNTSFKRELETDEANITIRYIKLKERHDYVLEQIKIMKDKINELKLQTEQEKEEISFAAAKQIQREEELGRNKIEEVRQLIEKRKEDHKQKIEKLNNKLELAQAATALEQDELEISLRRELVDLNAKIRYQQNSNEKLQMELDSLNRRQQTKPIDKDKGLDCLNFFQHNNLDDIFKLDSEASTTNNCQEIDATATIQAKHHPIKNWQPCHEDKVSKYQPLPNIRKKISPEQNERMLNEMNTKYAHVNKKIGSDKKVTQITEKQLGKAKIATKLDVPRKYKFKNQAEDNVNSTTNTKTQLKSRKLFNAEDLDYLETMNMESLG